MILRIYAGKSYDIPVISESHETVLVARGLESLRGPRDGRHALLAAAGRSARPAASRVLS